MPGACRSLGVFCLLTGCMVGPDYEAPEVVTPDAWRVDYESAADVSNTSWWALFEDSVLDELIDIALRENWDVRIAAGRIEEFAARVDIARSQLFPQLGYGVQPSRNHASSDQFEGPPSGSRTFSDYAVNANLNWEIDVWGRIRRSTEAGRAELLQEEESRRTVILTLVTAVATTYVTLRRLDRQLVVARDTVDVRAAALRLFETKFQGGVISEVEVAQVRSQYEEAAATIPQIERAIELTENALSVLLGRNPGPIPRGKTIDELVLPPVPGGVPSSLLTRRPDVRAAEQALIAANARIGVARARYFPVISLTGLFGFASEELDDVLGSSAKTWSIGASALGPIFAGGRIRANVRVSEAVERQSLNAYLQTVQTAFREVDDSLISVQKTREQLEVVGRRITALEDYVRLAQLRYDEGYTSYLPVLDARRSLFEAQLQYVDIQGEVYTSLVSTYKAMGGGWVARAQATADEVDFPMPEEQERPLLDFPAQTEPSTVGVSTGDEARQGPGSDR